MSSPIPSTPHPLPSADFRPLVLLSRCLVSAAPSASSAGVPAPADLISEDQFFNQSFGDGDALGAAPTEEKNGVEPHANADGGGATSNHSDAVKETTKTATAAPVVRKPRDDAVTFSSFDVRDEDEADIRHALIYGDFTSAVQRCLQTGRLADAIIFSSFGPTNLWEETRAHYFAVHPHPFIRQVMKSVSSSNLEELVATSNFIASDASPATSSSWKETLAILITYTTTDRYRALVNQLAERLEGAGHSLPALICYMCSSNVDKSVDLFSRQVTEQADPIVQLHTAMEKVAVFAQATSAHLQQPPSPSLSLKYSEYATLLASQGFIVGAWNYLRVSNPSGTDPASGVLLDRLYHASYASDQPIQQQPPAFPFHPIANVGIDATLAQVENAYEGHKRSRDALVQATQQHAHTQQSHFPPHQSASTGGPTAGASAGWGGGAQPPAPHNHLGSAGQAHPPTPYPPQVFNPGAPAQGSHHSTQPYPAQPYPPRPGQPLPPQSQPSHPPSTSQPPYPGQPRPPQQSFNAQPSYSQPPQPGYPQNPPQPAQPQYSQPQMGHSGPGGPPSQYPPPSTPAYPPQPTAPPASMPPTRLPPQQPQPPPQPLQGQGGYPPQQGGAYHPQPQPGGVYQPGGGRPSAPPPSTPAYPPNPHAPVTHSYHPQLSHPAPPSHQPQPPQPGQPHLPSQPQQQPPYDPYGQAQPQPPQHLSMPLNQPAAPSPPRVFNPSAQPSMPGAGPPATAPYPAPQSSAPYSAPQPSQSSPQHPMHPPTPAAAPAQAPPQAGTSAVPLSQLSFSPECQQLVGVLEGHYEQLTQKAAPTEQRKIADLHNRLLSLYQKLALPQSQSLSPSLLGELTALCQCVMAGDYNGCKRHHTALVKNDWTGNNEWILALKSFLDLWKKYLWVGR